MSEKTLGQVAYEAYFAASDANWDGENEFNQMLWSDVARAVQAAPELRPAEHVALTTAKNIAQRGENVGRRAAMRAQRYGPAPRHPRHRGGWPVSGGLPVPLTAAAALPAGAVVFPDQIVVFCDRCGTEAAHDYVVHDLMTREERLGVARAHLSADEGWSCTAYGDFCPACATTRPTGGNAAMADLRVQIHSHLRQHPWLTANEIGRMIGKHQATVRNTLRRMEADGEAVSRERPRTDGSGRMPAEWRAV